MAVGETYHEFIEKFKPKKTTDDCYTPPEVMTCVQDWVAEKYGLDKSKFVRPFWPGGDYENYDYPDGSVVVDNPPFSILSRIVQFYHWKNIPFFLFAPALTMMSSKKTTAVACAIIADASITFENGAVIRCGFLTNLEKEYVLKTEPELTARLAEICRRLEKEKKKEIPKYEYPDHIITCALAQKYAKYGINYGVERSECIFVRELDAQKAHKKSIYGCGLLLSERAAAERAAAERAAAERAAAERAAAERAVAERAAAVKWSLSDKEKELVRMLGRRT